MIEEQDIINYCNKIPMLLISIIYWEVSYMGKREDIIEVLKQIKPLITEDNGPTSIFVAGEAGENYRNLNISDLSADKNYITVTIGKYLFKRKYRISKDEI
jgi:hypothetical protein